MAEQEKQEQGQPANEQAGGAGKTADAPGAAKQTDQTTSQDKDAAGAPAEQTGEGTGAKAGEYS
jgi:hypothetical protein